MFVHTPADSASLPLVAFAVDLSDSNHSLGFFYSMESVSCRCAPIDPRNCVRS